MKNMIFLKIGWMKNYQGTESDKIKGGGVSENKHEIYNFQPLNGKMYGFVEPHNVNIQRIGAQKGDTEVNDVLVVWVATHPNGGGYIVGWYKNAILYKRRHNLPDSNRKNFLGFIVNGYITKADPENCTLIPENKRKSGVKVPYGKDGFGQYQIWYADADKQKIKEFRQKVVEFIETYDK